MISLLSILKRKDLVAVLLLLAYGSTFVVPVVGLAKMAFFALSDGRATVTASVGSHLAYPLSVPVSSEQESSDIDDNSSQEDAAFIALPGISIYMTWEAGHIRPLNNPPLSGTHTPPFTPPELRHV